MNNKTKNLKNKNLKKKTGLLGGKNKSSFEKPGISWVWWIKPVILATGEAEIGRIEFETSLGKHKDPISKITNTKRADRVA
jgi:hypothetical protein